VTPDQAPDATSLSSRRGVAILLLLSIVQFMDVLDADPTLAYRRSSDLAQPQSLLRVVNGYILPTAASCCSAGVAPAAAASSSSPAWLFSPVRRARRPAQSGSMLVGARLPRESGPP
jgi:hypothetical protein